MRIDQIDYAKDMNFQGRAYYNYMRMNWVEDPTLSIEPWQIEDYRVMALDTLFEKLEDLGFSIDKHSFMEEAARVDSPEELALVLSGETEEDKRVEGQIYLIVFELWRRLLPERLSLSIFCDEVDYLIYVYDHSESVDNEAIEDMIANLQMFLDENCDEGIKPEEAFKAIQSYCANDVEGFLADYISEQLDAGNDVYATELLEGFFRYVPVSKWFELLHARALAASGAEEEAMELVKQLIKRLKHEDAAFNFELLSFLVRYGDEDSFKQVVKHTIPLLEREDDFRCLLSYCADFYHRLDREAVEKAIVAIVEQRKGISLDKSLASNDPGFSVLIKQLSS